MNKTTQWIIGILITIAIAVSGYNLTRVDHLQAFVTAGQAEVSKTFLAKDQYHKDQSELCVVLKDLGQKIDNLDVKSETRSQKVLEALRQHERDAVKRDKVR